MDNKTDNLIEQIKNIDINKNNISPKINDNMIIDRIERTTNIYNHYPKLHRMMINGNNN